jgi:hypothetical protein
MKEEEVNIDSPRLKGKGISGFPLKVLQSLRDNLISMYDDLTKS